MRNPFGLPSPLDGSQTKLPVLPTLLTLGNAVCGLGSLTFAAQADAQTGNADALFYAGLFIFGAMVFDLLDGSVARWTHQTTAFGAELDSLCDAISFGVAPAFILLQISNQYHARILWVIAALFMVCAVLRLARFNVETSGDDQHDSFSGLPAPAAAATVASFVIVAPNASSLALPEAAHQFIPNEAQAIAVVHNLLPIFSLVLAGLMVSRVRYPHVANQALRGRRQFRQVAQIVFVIAAVVALGELAAPLIMCAFVLGAPTRALWGHARRKSPDAAPNRYRKPAEVDGDSGAEALQVSSAPRKPAAKPRFRWSPSFLTRRRRK
jgi:CDP-diacylglycerol--serine O-phosphatidyltransferase